MEITLGEMLKRFRIEKEVGAKEVCNGLCPTSMMSYYEKGERVPDSLLFECLVERLGMLPEEFSIMVMEKEYEYHIWREQVFAAIEEEQWEELEQLLQSDVTKKNNCNEKLEKQFYCYAKAICLGARREYLEAAKLLEIAKNQTIPDIHEVTVNDILLGKREFHILMLYLYYGVLGKVLDLQEGKRIFDKLESLIMNGQYDEHEKVKVYPKLIGIGILVLQEVMSEDEQLELCEKAIMMLRNRQYFCDITGILPQYIFLLEKNHRKELNFYKRQYEVFCEILEDAGVSKEFHPEQFVIKRSKFYLINEYLSFKRKEIGYTQEETSEGICEPETYSRVENAKRSPSRKNLKALADRLDMNWCYYRGELDTGDLKAFQLRRAHRDAEIQGDYKKSLELLSELEHCLDMDNQMNYQYVESNKCMMKYELGYIGEEEAYLKLENLLKLSNKMKVGKEYLVYYSQTEIEIITFLAKLREKQGRSKDGIILIETAMHQIQKSKVKLEYQWNGISYMLKGLSNSYFQLRDYDRALQVIDYVYKITIKRRDGSQLPYLLDAIGDILEHMEMQYSNQYKKLYRQSFYMADFFQITCISSTMKKFYEQHFEPEIIWYES